jgi:hypothetical protein
VPGAEAILDFGLMNQSLNWTMSLPFTRIEYNGQRGDCGKTPRDCHFEEPQARKNLVHQNAQGEILRFAQNDSREVFFRSLLGLIREEKLGRIPARQETGVD